MNRLATVLVTTVLAIGLLAVSANALLARALNAALPGLLEEQLGLPVRLAPLEVDLLRMHASSAQLVLGNPDSPAVQAGDVDISISFADLLKGELHIVSVSGELLQIAPGRWPATDEPAAANYLGLREWLPEQISLQRLVIVPEEGSNIVLEALAWQLEEDGGASVSAQFSNNSTDIALNATLASLHDLLALHSATVGLQAEVAESPGSSIAVQADIVPGDSGGYALEATLDAPGIAATIQASSEQPWSLPSRSNTHISSLLPDKLESLLLAYLPQDKSTPLAQWLDAPVPRLALPAHQGALRIEQAQWAGKTLSNTGLRIKTHADGLDISEFRTTALGALWQGDMSVNSDADGWKGTLSASVDTDKASEARDRPLELLGADYLQMESGSTQLTARGANWGELLYSLAGAFSATGTFIGTETVPLTVTGNLDNQAGAFALEKLAVQLGEGRLTGKVLLAGTQHRRLEIELQANGLDLSFLAATGNADANKVRSESSAEIPLAELAVFSGMDVNASIEVENLLAPGLLLASAQVSLTHQGQKDAAQTALDVSATDPSGGEYRLNATAEQTAKDSIAFKLHAELAQADLPALLRQPGLPHSRATGRLSLESAAPLAAGETGTINGSTEFTLALRADDDWQRAPRAGESLTLSADTVLTHNKQRLDEVRFENLHVAGNGVEISGTASLAEDRTPRLQATLESRELNLTQLQALLPENTEQAESEDTLSRLREFGSAELSLRVGQLSVNTTTLRDVSLEMTTGQERIDIGTLELSAKGGEFAGSGSISWEGDEASLAVSARLSHIDLDRFLFVDSRQTAVPLSGSLQLESAGASQAALLGNLSGRVDLSASESSKDAAPQSRRRILLQAERLPDGMQLDVSTLIWGDTDLSGQLTYQRGTPDTLSIDIAEGTLSLLPWESGEDSAPDSGKGGSTSTITSAAKTGASFVGNLLLSPLKQLADDTPTRAGDRVFSPEPIPVNALDGLNIGITGQLSQLQSSVMSAADIQFSASNTGRLFSASAKSRAMHGGQAALTLTFDARKAKPEMELESTFTGVKGFTGDASYPHSGFASISSNGSSIAELAANSSGIFYLELGSGRFEYTGMGLLSADIATSMLRTLLPGEESDKSKLECAAALFLAEDGEAATPYGLVARTNRANLVGRAQVNLRDETLRVQLDSRSHEGVGLSVGSLFSNTVELRGPLSDPRIEPNTASILWRGWAAVMTGGLSVVGESVLKRALASEEPCLRMQELMREGLCPNNARAASSSLVCPGGASAP